MPLEVVEERTLKRGGGGKEEEEEEEALDTVSVGSRGSNGRQALGGFWRATANPSIEPICRHRSLRNCTSRSEWSSKSSSGGSKIR